MTNTTSQDAVAGAGSASQEWETLPDSIPGVVAFFADRIETRLRRTVPPEDQPTESASVIEYYVNNPDPALLPTAEYLAQREAISELGLDPDVLAPIKPVDLLVGIFLEYLTFAEQPTRDCILWNGWSQADCDTICSQLVFVDPAAVAYVATLTPGVQTINGNLVNIIL